MPRYDNATPPEKRRAPKGSLVGRQTFRHTAESVSDFEILKARWPLTGDAIIRKALRKCAESEE